MSDWPEIGVVPAEGLPGRREPDLTQSPALTFNGSTRLVVMERQGEWARVRFPDGFGDDYWVEARGLLDPDSPEAMRPPQRVVARTEYRPTPVGSVATFVVPSPTGRYRSPRTHGGIAGALLVGLMLVCLVAFAATLVTIQAFDRVVASPFPSVLLDLETADGRRVALMWTVLGFIVVSFLGLIVWTRRMYRNLRAIGSPVQRYAPGWAVGGWFVPILSLWRPKAILNDVWRGTDPAAPTTPGERTVVPSRVDPVLDVWWVAWIGSSVTLSVSTRLDFSTSPRPKLVWLAVFLLAEAVSAGVGLWVVQRLTKRQEQRAARVLGPQDDASASVLEAPGRRPGLSRIAKPAAVSVLGVAVAAIAFVAWSVPNPVRAVPGGGVGGAGVYDGHGVQFEYPGELPAQESGLLGGEATDSNGVVVVGDQTAFISVAWFPNFGARSSQRDFRTILDGSFEGMTAETGATANRGELVETESAGGRFMYQNWALDVTGERATGVVGVTECESLERIALIQVIRSDSADPDAVLAEFLTLAGTVRC